MKWISTHGTDTSDIYVSPPWELIRRVVGFGTDRVTIIKHGVKVHQIEAQDGLQKAMDWCSRPTTPETDLEHVRMKSPAFFGEP